jgi:hypothetical protein
LVGIFSRKLEALRN